ncbi:transcriptional regulator [Aeromonas phage vB_AveS_KLEA5]|nr:transcriptional regulator [Aeromonas phage vB_AveS_KLEA5]
MTERKVWYVHSGMESLDRFDLLVSLTGLRSENQIGALRDHLVKGVPLDAVMVLHRVTNKSNLERDLDKINDVATTVEKIKEIDWLKARENKLII